MVIFYNLAILPAEETRILLKIFVRNKEATMALDAKEINEKNLKKKCLSGGRRLIHKTNVHIRQIERNKTMIF